ncbi:SAF domain-containing protein [Frankia sp. AgKG'84/4]|uniref:SAF domain-containing protein n=1 Tax=Frankia sp. AgKG'84/4 TaxID=573490 RepID=UPI00200DA358|nr:SAF domain-containing protein [Frankia sp. AgKG'84/4]MCL9793871.1 SAF domain-containing protein [Frankia sp. AgKG'84/4]
MGRLAFGLILVLLCAGVLTVMFTRAQHRSAVLAVARPVDAGQTIADADLRVAQVSADGLITIPASQRGQVVGRVAAMDLRPGMNLTPDALRGSAVPATGQTVAGVLFKPGQLPGRALHGGDRVELVTTSTSQQPAESADASSSSPATGAPTTRRAQVVTVTSAAGSADGSVVVDLLLDQADGPGVAADAAAGHLALLLLPRSG